MSTKSSLIALATGAALLAGASASHAQTLSFNFAGDSNTQKYIAPTTSAGVVPATNWQNDNGGANGSGYALYTSAGTKTGATVSYNSYDATYNGIDNQTAPGYDPNYANDGNSQIMNGFIESGTSASTRRTATVTASGLSVPTYSLYVYFYNSDGTTGTVGSEGGTFTVTSGTQTLTQNVLTQASFNPSTPFTLATASKAGDYLVFTGLTGTSFTLSATANTAAAGYNTNTLIPINAFQIVGTPAAAPEPSEIVTWVAGAGLLGSFAAKRRRMTGSRA